MIRRVAMKKIVWFYTAETCSSCCHENSRRFASYKGHSSGSQTFSSSSARGPFDALGISESCSIRAVKEAYRGKCQTEHPDVGGSEAGFRLIKEAYEECTRRVLEREERDSERSSTKREHSSTSSGFDEHKEGKEGEEEEEPKYGKYHRQSDAWYESQARYLRKQRLFFYGAFPVARTSKEMDRLLSAALTSHSFDVIDVGEPLVLALKHYHNVTGFGAPHLRCCFSAMDRWEEFTERRAGATMYHVLLQLYTDGPKPGLTESIIAESVESVMERMAVKSIEYDDWTLTLAHKTYRTSPSMR